MHQSVLTYVEGVANKLSLKYRTVLDVGSLNVNGSTRGIFKGNYFGVDMRDGPDVDLVLNAHDLETLKIQYEVVISTEMLEHDSAPWESVRQMRKVCEPGGFGIITCRGYGLNKFGETECFPVHDYPQDLWRYSVDGMRHLLVSAGWHPLEIIPDPQDPGVFATARA